MNGRTKMMIYLGLIGSSLLFFIISCSTIQNILSPRETEISQFFSTVRPYQGNPDSHYLLACYYQERGRHREAIEEFKKVLLIDPHYVKAYNGMGVTYDLLEDFSRAIEFYKEALKLNPNLDYIYNNLGYSYLLQGNHDEAITALKRAIAIDDHDKRFHINLGLAYAEKEQFELALVEFKLAGDEAKAHYNMAQLYFKKGLFDEAKSHYAIALKLNPSLTIVRTGLKAADALARIFVPTNLKKELVMPDHPVIKKEETGNIIAAGQLPAVKPDSGESMVSGQPETEKVKTEELSIPAEQRTTKLELLGSLKKAGIEISNGNGVNRMARRVGDYLKEKGLKITRLTNANHFNHSETIIFYLKGYDEVADHVAEYLPVSQNIKEIKKFDRQNIKVKVLIGKDLIGKNLIAQGKLFARNTHPGK